MKINVEKYTIYFMGVNKDDKELLSHMFPYQKIDIQNGIKYLGFHIKLNVLLKERSRLANSKN